VPVGLWEGSTENAAVVKALLADLVARGLDATDGLLVVIDGAKALSTAVRAVFGASAAIQRCTVHKRRNVADHLPAYRSALYDQLDPAEFSERLAQLTQRRLDDVRAFLRDLRAGSLRDRGDRRLP
jgi:transposase-like protein